MKYVTIALALMLSACDEEELQCHTTIDCSDDKESLCEAPVIHQYDDGEIIEIRACTYITYESCFEKTVCTPREQ